jgi:hypothetical protein
MLLQDLQRSPANPHPNPKFQLDQLTTACVALVRFADLTGITVVRQARLNMASRQSPPRADQPGRGARPRRLNRTPRSAAHHPATATEPRPKPHNRGSRRRG